MLWKSTYALVVISPAITTRPVHVSVSHATRLNGSSARQASRIASEIWSAILSGLPSVTDSLVNKKRSRFAKRIPPFHLVRGTPQPYNFTLAPRLRPNPAEPSGENRPLNREFPHSMGKRSSVKSKPEAYLTRVKRRRRLPLQAGAVLSIRG